MGILEGLLGSDMSDPKTMASLQLAAGLMGPGGFGTNLGKGLLGYQGTMANDADLKLKAQQLAEAKQQTAMQQLQFQRATDQYNRTTPIMDEAMRRWRAQQTGQPAPAGDPASPTAGGLGAPPAVGTPALQGGGQSPQGTMFAGVPDAVTISSILASGDMSKINDLIAKYNEPTNEQKNAVTMGYTPAMQLKAKLAADAKGGEIERRAGNEFANFYTGASGIVPKIPEYANPVGPVAANGAIPGGVTPMPNAVPIAARTTSAIEAAKEGSKVFTNVEGPGGAPVSGTGSSLFGLPAPMANNNPGALSPGGKLQQFATPEAGLAALDSNLKNYALKGVNTLAGVISKWAPPNENDTAAYIADAAGRLGIKPDQKIDLSNPVVRNAVATAITLHENGPQGVFGRAGVVTGQSSSDKTIAKTGADVISAAPQSVANSQAAITGLENALKLVESGIKTGPGASKVVNAVSILNNLGIPLDKGDLQGYQTLQKYLLNSLNSAAQGTGASGSDARFESFMRGQPSADTMNAPALASAIRYVLSQHDASVARGNFLPGAYQRAQAAGEANPTLTAQSQWSAETDPKAGPRFNPRFFEVQRLAPTEQAAAVRSMTPADAAKFLAWRQMMGQR